MEESKELQGFYKIFRAVVYISLLMEFFAYALEPEQLDFLGGLVTDIHSRIKRWMIYHDGNLVWSKIATILLICITCICLLYTSPSPRDRQKSRMPSSA